MDKIGGAFESFTGSGGNTNQGQGQSTQQSGGQQQSSTGGGILGGLGDKLSSLAGGGKESEKNPDDPDKGVNTGQEKVVDQGDQSSGSAVEQANDEQISDFLRSKYKSTAGGDVTVQGEKQSDESEE